MTPREKVLKAYEDALAAVKDMDKIKYIFEYLFNKGLCFGICYYCYYNRIEEFVHIPIHITDTPASIYLDQFPDKKSRIIKSLEFRINFLKYF